MPLKQCSLEDGGKGWQFGSSKCFPTKAQAVKMMRAMYANGYKGHSKSEEIPTEADLLELLRDDEITPDDDIFFELCDALKMPTVTIMQVIAAKKKRKGKNKPYSEDENEDENDPTAGCDDSDSEDDEDDDENRKRPT